MGAENEIKARVLWIHGAPPEDASALEGAGLVVREEAAAGDALDALERELPDLILLSSCGEQAEDVRACRDLRALTCAPILFLARAACEAFVLEVYQAGVDETILCPVSPRLLLAKVHAWLRRSASPRGEAAPSGQVRLAGFTLDLKTRRLTFPNQEWVRLTLLETRLMRILLAHPNTVFLSEELIEQVWGYQNQFDRRLLKNHIYRLRRKIEADPAHPALLVNVGYTGYQLRCEG